MPIVAFFSSAIGRWVAVAVLALAVYGGGYFYGYRAADTRCKADRAEAAETYLTEVMDEIERTEKISAQFADWQRTHARNRGGYSAGAARLAACGAIPAEFVGLLNAAATGAALPATTSQPACTPATVTYDTVASITAENLAACNEYIHQLNALITVVESRP